jgi:hypothetical protein
MDGLSQLQVLIDNQQRATRWHAGFAAGVAILVLGINGNDAACTQPAGEGLETVLGIGGGFVATVSGFPVKEVLSYDTVSRDVPGHPNASYIVGRENTLPPSQKQSPQNTWSRRPDRSLVGRLEILTIGSEVSSHGPEIPSLALKLSMIGSEVSARGAPGRAEHFGYQRLGHAQVGKARDLGVLSTAERGGRTDRRSRLHSR